MNASVEAFSPYRCPRTGRPLVQRGDALETADGMVRYPIAGSVPDFCLLPPQDAVTEYERRELAALAAREGWRAAVERHKPDFLSYIDDPTRAMFLDLLPIDRERDALEIGCALGQILIPLSKRARTVYGVELSPGQAWFAAERCRQSGCSNVAIAAGGDDLLLPFADDAFGTVVLNHVIEWVRMPGEKEVTMAAQKLLLSEIRRVLAPGGALFISTKNRFGLRLLLGGRDEHVRNIRFGSVLPKRLRDRLARDKSGFEGLLHSYPTFVRMLRDTGFNSIKSYWGAPDGRWPQRYVANDPDAIRSARRAADFDQGPTRTTRALMPWIPAPLVKLVTPGLAFVAR